MLLRLLVPAVLLLASCSSAGDAPALDGVWRASLQCPGGELPFGLELETREGALHGVFVNGEEKIEIAAVTRDGDALRIDIPHYDAAIDARVGAQGRELTGRWRRRSAGEDAWAELPFAARRQEGSSAPGPRAARAAELEGRWRVRFEKSDDEAVGVFTLAEGDGVHGTFLTTTGDYRFLAGSLMGDRLQLSCFDGAHAFLFTATLDAAGKLTGDFWSRDSWHETWSATKDAAAALPDAFAQVRWTGERDLRELAFPNLEGHSTRLVDLLDGAQAGILHIFGTWCPNCHDAGHYLAELQKRYAARGLRCVGLAFEHTDDLERNARQVRRHAERHGIDFPILIAGPSNKAEATRRFGGLSRIKSYPTTIFVSREGAVRAVHSGFTGPATGEAYVRLKKSFEALIEELLDA